MTTKDEKKAGLHRAEGEGYSFGGLITNVLLMAFTALLAIVGVQQYGILNRQLASMKIDQRAWLSFQAPPALSVPLANTDPSISLHLINTGKTAARNVFARTRYEILPMNQSASLTFNNVPQLGATVGMLAPGTIYPVLVPLVDEPSKGVYVKRNVTPEEADGLKSGSLYAAYVAELTYTDMYGVDHWTHFCNFSTFSKTNTFPMARSCSDFNDVDNNGFREFKPESLGHRLIEMVFGRF